MKKILFATLLFVIAAFVGGCQKDSGYTSGAISFDKSALYVATDNYGEELYSSFSHYNIVDVEIYSTPLGWEADVSFDEDDDYGMVTVYAPSKYYSGMDYTGSVVVRGETEDGSYTYAYLSVGMVDFVDLEETDQQANSMIASEPNTVYLFNPNIRGEGDSSYESSVKVTDCILLWRSAGSPIGGVMMYGNMVGFYTTPDSSDLDDDDDDEDLIQGNAVIAGISESGVVVWSWHIWVTDQAVGAVDFGGNTFMDRNIGALGNTNRDDEETLDTYGLYYQWGRKDPFIQPYYYNASGSMDAYLYNSSYSVVSYAYYQSNAATGFLGYATANPAIFIGGTEESKRDWLLPSYQNDDLWGGVSGAKSIYDPSPRGWRVPTAAELAGLNNSTARADATDRYDDTIDNYKDNYENLYGAMFTDDNSADNLFVAAGRRAYMNGTIQNYIPLDVDSTFRPWVGYYWSNEAAANDSDGYKLAKGLRFYLTDGDDGTGNVAVESDIENYRAMGMQIRCVKNE
ncbi:MAG: FISUMP domain-containing protein [Rikenellaceae bacterium]